MDELDDGWSCSAGACVTGLPDHVITPWVGPDFLAENV